MKSAAAAVPPPALALLLDLQLDAGDLRQKTRETRPDDTWLRGVQEVPSVFRPRREGPSAITDGPLESQVIPYERRRRRHDDLFGRNPGVGHEIRRQSGYGNGSFQRAPLPAAIGFLPLCQKDDGIVDACLVDWEPSAGPKEEGRLHDARRAVAKSTVAPLLRQEPIGRSHKDRRVLIDHPRLHPGQKGLEGRVDGARSPWSPGPSTIRVLLRGNPGPCFHLERVFNGDRSQGPKSHGGADDVGRISVKGSPCAGLAVMVRKIADQRRGQVGISGQSQRFRLASGQLNRSGLNPAQSLNAFVNGRSRRGKPGQSGQCLGCVTDDGCR